MVNILVVNGSPNGRDGNTYMLQEAFVKGASAAGATVEEVFLKEKKIKPCLGCYNCWLKTPGECAIKDDQAEILKTAQSADALVLTTPLYVDGMSAQTKTFVDRLITMARPDIVLRDDHCRHPTRFECMRKIALISTCGFYELDNFNALVFHCKRICLNFEAEYAGGLLRPHAGALKYIDLLPKEIGAVLVAAEEAGAEMARSGEISDATAAAVSAPIMPRDFYVQGANSYFQREIEKFEKKREKVPAK